MRHECLLLSCIRYPDGCRSIFYGSHQRRHYALFCLGTMCYFISDSFHAGQTFWRYAGSFSDYGSPGSDSPYRRSDNSCCSCFCHHQCCLLHCPASFRAYIQEIHCQPVSSRFCRRFNCCSSDTAFTYQWLQWCRHADDCSQLWRLCSAMGVYDEDYFYSSYPGCRI